jgi:hypothetical protein
MGNVEETTHRPALNGATRSYIVTAGVCFSIVGLLLLGYAQEDAARKANASQPAIASSVPASGQPPITEQQADRNTKTDALALKSKGKFEALDKADQDFLNGLTSGHGREMLQMRWEAMKHPPEPTASQPIDPETRIREVVERTKGDYSKVTAEEKSKMDTFTSGHGKQYFESRVKLWKESLQSKSGKNGAKTAPPAVSK